MSIIAENTRRIIKERGLKIGAVGKQAGYQGKTFYNLLSGSKVITDKDVRSSECIHRGGGQPGP